MVPNLLAAQSIQQVVPFTWIVCPMLSLCPLWCVAYRTVQARRSMTMTPYSSYYHPLLRQPSTLLINNTSLCAFLTLELTCSDLWWQRTAGGISRRLRQGDADVDGRGSRCECIRWRTWWQYTASGIIRRSRQDGAEVNILAYIFF
jgi:hypothetical protein